MYIYINSSEEGKACLSLQCRAIVYTAVLRGLSVSELTWLYTHQHFWLMPAGIIRKLYLYTPMHDFVSESIVFVLRRCAVLFGKPVEGNATFRSYFKTKEVISRRNVSCDIF